MCEALGGKMEFLFPKASEFSSKENFYFFSLPLFSVVFGDMP